jgi:thiol-disulfide isomerase/thioredoxin
MKNTAILSVLMLTLFALACGTPEKEASKSASGDDVATTIENASFVTLDGERVNVSDFEGKVVLVDFWETWCVPCLNSMPTFQQVIDEHPDKFVVLAVSPGWSDTPEDIKRFTEQHPYDFIFVLDEDEVSANLDIAGIPYKIFVGPDGKYVSTELGSGGHQRDYAKIIGILEKQVGL